jgi:hypothetical protein
MTENEIHEAASKLIRRLKPIGIEKKIPCVWRGEVTMRTEPKSNCETCGTVTFEMAMCMIEHCICTEAGRPVAGTRTASCGKCERDKGQTDARP